MVLYLLNTPTRPPPFQDLEGKNDLLRPCVVGNSFVISLRSKRFFFWLSFQLSRRNSRGSACYAG